MNRFDFLAAIGMGFIVGGLWWIYPPAGLIGLGIMLIGLGVIGAYFEARKIKGV